MTKRKTVPTSFQLTMRADEILLGMVDAIMAIQGYKSRSAVLEQALRDMYNAKFPAYKTAGRGAPTLARAIVGGVPQLDKQMLKKEEADRLREYGTYVCKEFYIDGKPVNTNTNEPQKAVCEFKIVKGVRLKDSFSEVTFGDMPVGTGEWDEDIVLRRFVLGHTFPDFKFEELDPDKAQKNFTKQIDLLITGCERGEIDRASIPTKLLTALAEEARDRKVDQKFVDALLDLKA